MYRREKEQMTMENELRCGLLLSFCWLYLLYLMLGYLDTLLVLTRACRHSHRIMYCISFVFVSHLSVGLYPCALFKKVVLMQTTKYSTVHRSDCVHYKARCFIRLLTVLNPAYTLPGGDPSIRDTIASRATLIFWKEPIICIFLGRGHEAPVAQVTKKVRTCPREQFSFDLSFQW